MSVNGIGVGFPAWRDMGKSQRNGSGTGFAGRMAGTDMVSESSGYNFLYSKAGGRFSAYDAYSIMGSMGSRFNTNNLKAETNQPVEKVESERYLIEPSDEISGYWRIYDKKLDKSFEFDPNNTSVQTDGNSGKNYIVATDPRGGLMDVVPAGSELMETLAQFLNVDNADSIPTSSLNEKYTIEVNAFTGIECLKIKGNEGGGSWLMVSDEQQMGKLRELADMYKEKYPNLIKSESVAMGFAQAEVAGQAVRTEDGIMMITCNGMNYMDDANPSRSWAVMYPIGATHMYMEIMNAMAEGYIEAKDIKEYSKWEKYFEERGLEFERILSDEELEQADKQESESKTDIIVKPDGSRVLVMTMSIGGMETTMSLEISKPTEAPNENSEHDTDNNMPSDDPGMDTVSDEMSNISTEA